MMFWNLLSADIHGLVANRDGPQILLFQILQLPMTQFCFQNIAKALVAARLLAGMRYGDDITPVLQ